MDFVKFREEYEKNKADFKSKKMDEATYNAFIEKAFLTDEKGETWTISKNTGQWMVYRDGSWKNATPPTPKKDKTKESSKTVKKPYSFKKVDWIALISCSLYIIAFIVMTSLNGFTILEFIVALGAFALIGLFVLPLIAPGIRNNQTILTLIYIVIALAISLRVLLRFFTDIQAFAALLMFASIVGLAYSAILKIPSLVNKKK